MVFLFTKTKYAVLLQVDDLTEGTRFSIEMPEKFEFRVES
jgi:hypothetical protein